MFTNVCKSKLLSLLFHLAEEFEKFYDNNCQMKLVKEPNQRPYSETGLSYDRGLLLSGNQLETCEYSFIALRGQVLL